MLMKNYRSDHLRWAALGIDVAPGEEVEVEEGYCLPLVAPNGGRIPSTVEGLCPGLEPADEEYRKEWKTARYDAWINKPKVAKSASQIMREHGVSPGVAAILAARDAASMKIKEAADESAGAKPPKKQEIKEAAAEGVKPPMKAKQEK